MQTVLLAGGLGTRLREETEFRPKPMVEIGNRPLLWHIMKIFENCSFREFIICAGYKSEMIKQYFGNPINMMSNIVIDYLSKEITKQLDKELPDWRIIVSDTGLDTMTGGRIKKIEKYVKGERFFCTYGDGLSDIDVNALLDFHVSHGKLATLTAVHPTSRFGKLTIDPSEKVIDFDEKPMDEEWVNGGFFVFETAVFDFLTESSILEKDLLPLLARQGQLVAFKHHGFWQPMDTYREVQLLNHLWNKGEAPWKTW